LTERYICIHGHFYQPPRENAWLEFENVPLKWHWPVGVLYDLFTGRDPADAEEEHGLPWNLILHFQSFPAKHLMHLDTPTACHDAWINCVKEADFVRHGNAKTVMSLSKAESTKLWEGLSSHDFDKFWSVNEKLVGQSSGPPRSIPIRLYVPSTPRVIQQPVHPLQESRELQTVGTALNSLLPELFPLKRVPVLARPVVHGVVVLMTTPLIELLQAAVFPDGFLHITLAMMS